MNGDYGYTIPPLLDHQGHLCLWLEDVQVDVVSWRSWSLLEHLDVPVSTTLVTLFYIKMRELSWTSKTLVTPTAIGFGKELRIGATMRNCQVLCKKKKHLLELSYVCFRHTWLKEQGASNWWWQLVLRKKGST